MDTGLYTEWIQDVYTPSNPLFYAVSRQAQSGIRRLRKACLLPIFHILSVQMSHWHFAVHFVVQICIGFEPQGRLCDAAQAVCPPGFPSNKPVHVWFSPPADGCSGTAATLLPCYQRVTLCYLHVTM